MAAAGAVAMADCQFPKKGMMKKRGQGLSAFGVKNWKVCLEGRRLNVLGSR